MRRVGGCAEDGENKDRWEAIVQNQKRERPGIPKVKDNLQEYKLIIGISGLDNGRAAGITERVA